MSEQDQTEEKGGSGAKIVGGLAGGGVAGYFANKHVAGKLIKDVIDDKKEALPKAKEAVTKIFKGELDAKGLPKLPAEKGAAALPGNKYGTLNAQLDGLDLIANKSKDIETVRFLTDKKGKGFAMYVSQDIENERGALIKGIKKLPEGFTAGKTVRITDLNGKFDAKAKEAIGSLFTGGEKAPNATLIADGEKALNEGIRKAAGHGFALKNAGFGGKAAVIGLAVAGVGAGAIATNAIFGGKHTEQVAQQRSDAEVSQAAGRA